MSLDDENGESFCRRNAGLSIISCVDHTSSQLVDLALVRGCFFVLDE
jgi:hypothetical protein